MFRQMGDAPVEWIAQPAVDGDTSFVDHLPRGNVAYRYFMKNELDHGVVLDSRALMLRPFLFEGDFDVGAPPGARFLLAPSDGVHSRLLALIAAPEVVLVCLIGVDGVEDDPIGLALPDYENMNVSSLSFCALPFGIFADPHFFVAGIEPGAQRVRLHAFALRGGAAQPVAWDHAAWPVDDPQATTAMGVGANGEIVVAVGQALRIFAPQGQGMVEVAAWPLGLESAVRSLSVGVAGMWAVTADGRVWRSAWANDPHPYVREAEARYRQGDYAGAVHYLLAVPGVAQLAPALTPMDERSRARVFFDLGCAYLAAGDSARADEAFKEAFLLNDRLNQGYFDNADPGMFWWALLRNQEAARRMKSTRLGAARRSIVVPGWGQFYRGHTQKGYAFMGASLIASGVLALQVREFNFARRDYRSVEPRQHLGVRYVNTSGVPEELQGTQYTEWETRHRVVMVRARRVNVALAILSAIWALNVVDSTTFGPAPMGLTVSF